MKRLLVYHTYDKQNIIDDYIGYFLGSMRAMVDTIIVVCNMPGIDKGFRNLSDYADGIFYRENIGLDAGGFKDALCTFVGWEKIRQYDELILANDSFYGPFDNIRYIFEKMESRELDFWGLMKRGPGEYGNIGRDPEHILSFFYVFQSRLLRSEEFRSYWEDMPYYKDYMSAVKQYERQLTRYFSDLGYSYGAYADTAPNESKNLKNQFFQCDYLCYEMLTKRNFPFLKRKQLSYNTLYLQTQENLMLSLEHIEKYTDYNVNLIWENLIRTQNHTKLQRSLGLQYILEDVKEGKNSRILVCVRAEWLNALETVVEYLDRIKDMCEIQVITKDEETAACYREEGFSAAVSKQTDIQLLQKIDTEYYTYICWIHDTDLSSDQFPSCSGKSYFLNVWENLIRNAGYIKAVTKLLDEKNYLGMLMHPVPIFGTWLGKCGYEWMEQYDKVKKYVKDLGLQVVLSRRIPPVHITNNFWIRADIVRKFQKNSVLSNIIGIPDGDFKYLWSFMVQDAGGLTGIVESSFYASMNETNHQYYLQTFMEWFTRRYGPHVHLHEFEEIFYAQAAIEECRSRYRTWYVYGTGDVAENCSKWTKDATAFVVSDGQPKQQEFHGKPVLYVSELKKEEEFGIVLCLGVENEGFVAQMLEEQGIHNYYTIHGNCTHVSKEDLS